VKFQCIDILEPRYFLSAALDLIGVTAMRNDPTFDAIDGSGVSVAIIDTGVDFTHPLLQSAEVAAHDFVRNNNQSLPTDEHGTHVAAGVGADRIAGLHAEPEWKSACV
jgi:subtilisin family serine protease